MLRIFVRNLCFIFLLNGSWGYSQEVFKVIVLGCGGGVREDNMCSYLIAPSHSNDYLALDAGSVLSGLCKAYQKNSFQDLPENLENNLQLEFRILQDHIKAYCISHAHLDHVAGLVINSQSDVQKSIFGIDSVIDFLRDHLFNWKVWPNFGSEGNAPQLNLYQYQRLEIEKPISIPNTEMSIEPFVLSHKGDYESTAFLVETSGMYAVYFGDTSPDEIETKKRLEKIWKRLAPLVLEKKLCGIFLECSYEDKDPKQLYGHLDAKYMIKELFHFASIVDPLHPEKALKGLKVIVTHIKDSLFKGVSDKQAIALELERCNNLGIEFIFPEQGDRISL